MRAKGTFEVRLCDLVVHKLGLRVIEELGKSTKLFMTLNIRNFISRTVVLLEVMSGSAYEAALVIGALPTFCAHLGSKPLYHFKSFDIIH